MKYLFLISLLAFMSFAKDDWKLGPKPFEKDGVLYAFTDFKTVKYNIHYDIEKEKAIVETGILFKIPIDGRPLFDLVGNDNATARIKKGLEEDVNIIKVRSPHTQTYYKSIDKTLKAGSYLLKIKSEIQELVKFTDTTVRSAFWMSDLEDREFLERYIPSNLDFDMYHMVFDIKITGTDKPHTLIINCENQEVEKNHFLAKCSNFYNSSSLFYHLFPEGFKTIKKGSYKSIAGRDVPITAYGARPDYFIEKSKEVLKELELDYGPWPHPGVIIYGAGLGGMEYSGATMTSSSALGHELHHSYFARSIHPAGGNAGWIDEAMASWRDNGYPSQKTYVRPTQMAGHSPYRRDTDQLAYSKGAEIIAHFDYLFKDKGGMKTFMKDMAKNYVFKPLTTPIFQKQLEGYFQTDLSQFFNTYIYGKKSFVSPSDIYNTYKNDRSKGRSPYHVKMTKAQLESLL